MPTLELYLLLSPPLSIYLSLTHVRLRYGWQWLPECLTDDCHAKNCKLTLSLSFSCVVGDQNGRFLEFLGNKFYYKSSPNVLWLFGQLWNPLLFKSNCWCYILGNFWKNLGYFLFQHLVTLLEVVWKKNKCEREFPSSLFFQRETI